MLDLVQPDGSGLPCMKLRRYCRGIPGGQEVENPSEAILRLVQPTQGVGI